MAPPLKTVTAANTSDGLLQRAARLHPADRMMLRLKALIGPPTGKNEFLAIVNAANVTEPNARPWSMPAINGVLNRLVSQGLLDKDLSCPTTLWHPLAVDALAAPEGPVWHLVVLDAFPEPRRHHGYSAIQSDWTLLRRLRLAIYANDGNSYHRLLESYQKHFVRSQGPHVLEALFLDATLEVNWLASRVPEIRDDLFRIKLAHFVGTGHAPSDLPALISHVRANEDQPGYEALKWELLHSDLLAGRIGVLRRKIDAIPTERADCAVSTRLLLRGSVNFLEGRNDEALADFRQALSSTGSKPASERSSSSGPVPCSFCLR